MRAVPGNAGAADPPTATTGGFDPTRNVCIGSGWYYWRGGGREETLAASRSQPGPTPTSVPFAGSTGVRPGRSPLITPLESPMNNVIYIVGLVVVVGAILAFVF